MCKTVMFVYYCRVYINWVNQFLDVCAQLDFPLVISGCKQIFSFSHPWKYVESRGMEWKQTLTAGVQRGWADTSQVSLFVFAWLHQNNLTVTVHYCPADSYVVEHIAVL